MTKPEHQDDWIAQENCPACSGTGRVVGELFTQTFHFGSAEACLPPVPVNVLRCASCGLTFKSLVPGPAFLERLTHAAQADLWPQPHDFSEEMDLVSAINPTALNDVIDIGAASGGFLSRLPETARKSALDIVRFANLKINDEFVAGFLDQPKLEWSGRPYGLVGLFDVAEHLYDPRQAFANLRSFCRPGGLVIIETGDCDAVPEGWLDKWNYLNLLEHHMAWNRSSLEAIARNHGFTCLSFERKAHKGDAPTPWRQRLKARAFRIAPKLARAPFAAIGKLFDVPKCFRIDHMRMVLRAD
jgi:SAM-dependent methyltransferase